MGTQVHAGRGPLGESWMDRLRKLGPLLKPRGVTRPGVLPGRMGLDQVLLEQLPYGGVDLMAA